MSLKNPNKHPNHYAHSLQRVINLALTISLLSSILSMPSLAVASAPVSEETSQEEITDSQSVEPEKEIEKKTETTPQAKETSSEEESKPEQLPKEEKAGPAESMEGSVTKETASESAPETETKETADPEEQSEANTQKEATSESESESESKPKTKDKPKHISEADMLLLKNNLNEAEKAYRSLIEEDETGDAYAGLAVALAKQKLPKKVIEAEKILRKGMQDFPDNPNMKAAAGFVGYEHSKTVASPAKRDKYLEAAENLCEQAIESNPDIVIAQQTLGLVKMTVDDAEAAIKPFRVCYEVAQDSVNGTLLAQAMLKVNPKDSEAADIIDQVLETDPEYSPAKLQKSIVLTNKGKHEEAFIELHSIPREDRESDWYKVQGDIYRKQGDGNSAVSSWKESIRTNPRNPDPYKNLAEYYMLRGDGEFSIAEMHSALEILPNDVQLRQKLAELALRLDKLEVAEQEFRTILSVKQDDPSALLGLARVFFRRQRREGQYPQGWVELMDKLQDVIMNSSVSVKGKLKPFQEKIELAEAEKALTQKQFRDAGRYFKKIINNHKENPFELLTLAEQAYNDGDLKSAELAYSYAREIPEVAPRAEQGISKISSQRKEAERQTKLGDATEKKLPDVAEDHYKQALVADPQNGDAYYNIFFLFLKERKDEVEKTIDYGESFLEASDDSDNRRQQVEKLLFKLKDRLRKENSK